MTALDRREFLRRSQKTTLGLAAGVTILQNARSVRGAPANEKLVLGSIGVHGRGNMLAHGFLDRGDCVIAYVADVNAQEAHRVEEYAKRQGGTRPAFVQDFRKMLDDKSVDAAVIATPPHWHALATIWCCQAGKDVYCEKPQSHNPWEGRKAVEAARTYKRIVQIGTQNRSAPYNWAAKRYIEEGKLGRIHLCRVFNQKYVANFQWPPDSDPPKTLDWEMWNGPAPQRKYNSALHLQWRQLWDYSGGDMAYDAVHQVDLARWLLGVDYPKTVYCTGGRFDASGAAETPDTQVACFEFDHMTVAYEQTLDTPYMLKTDGGVRDGDMFPYWMQNTTRIEIYGTEGVMFVGRMGGGWQVFTRPKSRQPVVKDQRYGRFPDPDHKEDFVQCVRSRKLPNADIEEGHRSVLLVHYANISLRLGGQKLVIDPKTERFVGNDEANKLFKRQSRKPWAIEEAV